jgi:fatty-acyl-CoA synthase
MPLVDDVAHWVPDPAEQPAIREMTVADLLDESVDRWPGNEAIVYSAYADRGIAERWTYEDLRARARRTGRALMAAGLEAGDRVGLWATNVPQWLELQFGAAYAGVVIVPLNPLYRKREITYVLSRVGAAGCFALPADRGTSLWGILTDAARDLPALRLRVAIGEAPEPGGPSWDEFLAGGDKVSDGALEDRRRTVRPQDTSQIQFTSGTTGFPKGAELSHLGLANNGRLFAHRAMLPEGGRHCNPMPFFHCGGCVLSTLGSVATGSAQTPMITFEAERMVRTMADERCTSGSAVPTMLIAMDEAMDRTGIRPEALQIVVTGGSPVPVEVERRWTRRLGVRFTVTYGLTETSPVMTQSSPEDDEEHQLGTCGRPLPHVEIDVVDPASGERVAVGTDGEVRTRGWLVMKGYHNDPEATARTIAPDGFLATGDIGRLDAEGYLSITGRVKEMIIRGGENIYPAEVEDALRALPQVADVGVVGVPSARYGEEVAAYVRCRPGEELTLEGMRAALADQIARFKVPAHLRIVDALPLTPSGKVQKFRLREMFTGE